MADLSKYLSDFDNIASYVIKNGRLNGSENNNTASILMPFLQDTLSVMSDFDEDDSEGNRPDLVLYADIDRKKSKQPSVLIESKIPEEFKELSMGEILDKYLEDKIVKYIIANRSSSKVFIIHCFTRFLCFEIDKDLLVEIDLFRSNGDVSARRKLLKNVNARCKDFNFQLSAQRARAKILNQLVSYLCATCSSNILLERSASNYVNTLPLKSERDLRKHGDTITRYAGAKRDEPGLFKEILTYLNKELSRTTSPAKINYRLFLSTRFPDIADSKDLDSNDNPHEREVFCLSSMYSLIGKVFLQKYVQDCFSDGPGAIVDRDSCFLHKSIAHLSNSEVLAYYKNNLSQFASNVPEALNRLLTRNDFFDWILTEDCLKESFFKQIIIEFQRIDFFTSTNATRFKGDLLGAFFEIFTEKFDQKTRQDLGQYYTPKPIVKFMWNRVHRLIEKQDLGYKNMKILDPACGSGTFAVEAVNQLWDNLGIQIADRLVAFDISPFSSGLAEINLFSEILARAPIKQKAKIPALTVFNTDSLDMESSEYWERRIEDEESQKRLSYLKDQKQIAKELKRKNEYTVIVTNPPYNGSSNRTLKSFGDRFDLTAELNKTLDKDDRIRDDYVWFMAAIDHYIDENGIITLITNDSYVTKRSYQSLRAYLARNYNIHELYLFGEGMFDDVKAATAIIVLSKFKNPQVIRNFKSSVDVYDLRSWKANSSNREMDERYMFLEGKKSAAPRQVTLSESNGFSFTSERELHDYMPITGKGKGLAGAIGSKESGVVTGSNDLFCDENEDRLVSRFGELFEIATHASFLFGKAVLKNPTNEDIKNLAINFLERSKYSELRPMIDDFASKWNVKRQDGKGEEKVPLYVAFGVASVVLQQLVFDAKNVRDCVKMSSKSRWSFEGAEKLFIYLDDQFVIPRVNMRSGSKISGGPRTSWAKDHDLTPKICFTTPSSANSPSVMVISDDNYSPIILKTPLGSGESHFVPLMRLQIPEAFQDTFKDKIDYAYYLQGVLNSEWITRNHDFVISNKAPIPMPRDGNQAMLLQISTFAKYLNQLVKFDVALATATTISKEFINLKLGSELANKILSSASTKLTKQDLAKKLEIMIESCERELNQSVNSLFNSHMVPQVSRKSKSKAKKVIES